MRDDFESQAILQPAGHGGVSQGRGYLLARVANDTMDLGGDTGQDIKQGGQEMNGYGNFIIDGKNEQPETDNTIKDRK